MNRAISSPLDLLVRKLQLHVELPFEDQQAVLELPFRLRSLEAQSYIVREGDKPDRCAVLLSGFAIRHKLTGDGARQILSIHIAGDALDFQNLMLPESDHNVQMLTRGDVAEIPVHAIEELFLERRKFAEAVMMATVIEASIFREWTLNVGRRDSRTRIAHLLCEFAYRMDRHQLVTDGGYELPVTQEQLADATGLTPVHVNRVLKGLQADGLISRDRRVIRFPDFDRLREAGDFNSRYLHARDNGEGLSHRLGGNTLTSVKEGLTGAG